MAGHLWKHATVGVLLGGLSRERDVSLNTGAAIAEALEGEGYRVVKIDARRDLPAQLVERGVAVVFNALHGVWAEDGRLQGLLDWMGIPYTGEGLAASLFAFDKNLAKQRFRAAGLRVADDVLWEGDALKGRTADDLPFPVPVAIKPVADGSSVGVTLVHDPAQVPAALAAAAPRALIEQFVHGPELSVAVMGDRVLGSVEIEPARAFYDYEAKYGQSGTRYHLPPRLDAADRAAVEAAALAAHTSLGCRGATRTDVILGPDGPVVIEVNTLPGMTPTSLLPKIAAHAGIPFGELCARILDAARFTPGDEAMHADLIGSEGGRHGR